MAKTPNLTVRSASMQLLPALSFCVAGFAFSAASSRAAFDAESNTLDRPPLRDMIHDRYKLDHTNPSSIFFCMPDRIAIVVLVGSAAMLLSHGIDKTPALVREACVLMGILQFLRGLVVCATTYPATTTSCRGRSDLSTVHQPCFIEIYCNDLMFSGHTCVNVASAMLWSYSKINIIYVVLWWAFVLFGCIVSVATRDHYSADVLVAFIISVLVGMVRRQSIRAAFSSTADELSKNKSL